MSTEETTVLETAVSEKPAKAPELSTAQKKHMGNFIWATGRRKSAIAQVRVSMDKNTSKITVNKQSVDQYFRGNNRQALKAMQSLKLVKGFGKDLMIRVKGGGINGQAEAIRHGIARVLTKWDSSVKMTMRKEGYLTRDPRTVERKKPGQPKARKRFQYSKR